MIYSLKTKSNIKCLYLKIVKHEFKYSSLKYKLVLNHRNIALFKIINF